MKSTTAFIRAVVALCMLAACERNAGESSGHESPGESLSPHVTSDSNLAGKDKTASLLPSIAISYKDLRPELQELITGFREKRVRELATYSREFIVLKPGPGRDPVVGYGRGADDLMRVDEVHELMDFENWNGTIYRLVPDKCTVIETFPEGIYLREMEGENVQISLTTDDGSATTRLNAALKQWNGKKGIELLIKFTSADEPYFIDFFFYEDGARLHLGMIDQRSCGV